MPRLRNSPTGVKLTTPQRQAQIPLVIFIDGLDMTQVLLMASLFSSKDDSPIELSTPAGNRFGHFPQRKIDVL